MQTMLVTYFLVLQYILVLTQCLGRYYLKSVRFSCLCVEFLTHPDNITALDGTEVEFSCVAVTDVITYRVNDTLVSEEIIVDKGSIQPMSPCFL